MVLGHPVHAILSDLPATLIPTALLCECVRRVAPRPETQLLSGAATLAASAAGLAAAVVGWIDWLTMPTEHPAQKPATLHGLINSASVVAVWGAAWLPSRRLMLLGLGTVGVVAGSWIGGELVFRHGWRVRAAEEAELVESRLQAEGRPDYFDQARAEVSDFERSKTILGG